jgi:hypothetical protein
MKQTYFARKNRTQKSSCDALNLQREILTEMKASGVRACRNPSSISAKCVKPELAARILTLFSSDVKVAFRKKSEPIPDLELGTATGGLFHRIRNLMHASCQ